MTFSVTTTGTLDLTVPDSTVSLDTGVAPGQTASGLLGDVVVADNRDLDGATWTVSASDTDFKTGSGTGNSLILADLATYITNTVTSPTAGSAAAIAPYDTGGPLSSTTPADVVSEAGFNGANDATWDPTISIAVPSTASTGTYSGTITHSLS